jgi:hypothetical protein
MPIDDYLIVSTSKLGNPRFYIRRPLLSGYFLAGTFFFLVSLAIFASIVARYGSKLSEFGVYEAAAAGLGTLFFLARAFREHSRMHGLYRAGRLPEVPEGSPLDSALRMAASMTTIGTIYVPVMFFLAVAELWSIEKLIR